MNPTWSRALLCAWMAALGCTGPDGGGGAGVEDGGPEEAPGLAPSATPSSGASVLTGMMTYMADAPSFTDCVSGARFPIAQEGGYLALERAYLDQVTGAGSPLRVSVLGGVEPRAGMEGGTLATLVVVDFLETSPGAGCGEAAVDQPLERTEWLLTEVMDAPPVPPGAGASLRLEGDEGQLSGHTGCNRFNGSYELAGGRLTLALGGMTRMACDDATATLERDYLEALRLTGGFRVLGSVLELLGPAGPVARFRAPAPR